MVLDHILTVPDWSVHSVGIHYLYVQYCGGGRVIVGPFGWKIVKEGVSVGYFTSGFVCRVAVIF